MPPAVSLIAVYYNTPEDLLRLQESIRRHLPAELYELIVVDNASEKDLSAQMPDAIYLRQESNGGFGKASNRGAEKASAPVLFFVNPDCEFTEDCVTPLLNALQRAAVCGPRVLYPDGAEQVSFGPFLSIRNEALQKQRLRNERTPRIQNWLSRRIEFSPDYVSGCAMMVRADVFRQVGGFDEQFFLYQEDVDLCKRIRQLGYDVLYVPSARIVHQKNKSADRVPEKVRLEYRKSQIHYYRKHHGLLQNLLLRLYLAVSRKAI